ncbi:hypothetical protein H1R20_g8764, partial [Candolleomyces eurysporus]
MSSAPIAIPSSSSSSRLSMSTSPSTGRYVPVHKRSASASRAGENPSLHPVIEGVLTFGPPVPVLTYSRDELLALAPSTSWSQPEALSSSPEQFHHLQQQVEPHQGWGQAHEAMRDYLRVVCPDIVLNRKMRKSLQFHQHQHHQQQRVAASPAKQHPRPLSPASSSTSSDERQYHERRPAAVQPSQQQVPSRPATPSSFKRVTPRRNRPAARTNSRTARFNGFTAFHKQLSGVAAAAEADWRAVKPVVTAAH